MLRFIFTILFLFILCVLQAQIDTSRANILFPLGSSRVNTAYKNNKPELDSLIATLHAIQNNPKQRLERVEINAYASPDGQLKINLRIAQKRCNATEQYIRERVVLHDSLIVKSNRGVAWGRLRAMVAESNMKYGKEVLSIIDKTPEETWVKGVLVNSRNKHLMDLRGGVPYRYMMKHFYPDLRNSSTVSIHYNTAEKVIKVVECIISDDITLPEFPINIRPTTLRTASVPIPLPGKAESEYKPRFAIKTNLLFDAALMPNVEFEWFFNDKMSINLDYQFAWWTFTQRDRFYQIMMFSPEFRYWFRGDGQFKGHFGGVYLGTGYYDLKWEKYGFGRQGELYIAAGLSYGYHLPIKERFGMEFSVGIGYMVTNYRKYLNMREYSYYGNTGNHYVYKGSDRTTYFGPTKAKISLVWRLGEKKGGSTR